MVLDRYSKIILTVIALALAVIAVGQLVPKPVVAQGGAGCGIVFYEPCYVIGAGTTRDGRQVLPVNVVNP